MIPIKYYYLFQSIVENIEPKAKETKACGVITITKYIQRFAQKKKKQPSKLHKGRKNNYYRKDMKHSQRR